MEDMMLVISRVCTWTLAWRLCEVCGGTYVDGKINF